MIVNRTPPVTEAKIVEVEPAVTTISLTDEELDKLTALLGLTVDAEYLPVDADKFLIHLYKRIGLERSFSDRTRYRVVDIEGKRLPTFMIRPY